MYILSICLISVVIWVCIIALSLKKEIDELKRRVNCLEYLFEEKGE